MVRCIAFVCVALLLAGSLGGCVNALDVKKLQDQEQELRTEIVNLQNTVKALDERLTKKMADDVKMLDGKLAKSDGEITKLSQQLPAVKAEIEAFSKKFSQMNSAIEKAQALIVKNLENARDIYKTQFLALEEVLQNMKKSPEPEKPPTTPAPK